VSPRIGFQNLNKDSGAPYVEYLWSLVWHGAGQFARLNEDDQATIRRVSGLLRVADGLDRGHTAAVDRVTVALEDGRCVIRASPRVKNADVSLEVWGAQRKSDVLAKALGCEVVVEEGPGADKK